MESCFQEKGGSKYHVCKAYTFAQNLQLWFASEADAMFKQ